jgi:hypothetical protein
MTLITAPFRQLVERRLWPVAVLLVAALAAVPVLLKHDGDAAAPPAATAATTAADGSQATLVTASDPGAEDDNPKVLGERKNPFQPAHEAKAVKTAAAASAAPAAVATGGGSASGSGSGSSSSSSSSGGAVVGSYGPVTPSVPVTPATPGTSKPTFSMYSLEVAFGDPVRELAKREVKRLTGLPGGTPAVIYIGLMPDHRTAVFVVDAGVSVQGDGACEPSPTQCQTLRMKGGDTVFLTRPGGKQYELDLVKVHAKATTSARAARAARTTTARGGREALRAQLSRVGAYRFSERTGTLKVLSPTAWKASVARAAAASAPKR